jgi:hypothetical protein
VDCVPEEVIEQEVGEFRVLVVGRLDVAQEHGADDATAAPHQSNAAIVLNKNVNQSFVITPTNN